MTDRALFLRRFLFMLVSYMLMPLSFIIMTIADFEGNTVQRILAYSVGVLFWLGVIAGTVFLILLNRTRKKDSKGDSIKGLPGILHFFSCRQGKIIDIVFIFTVLVCIVLGVFHFLKGNIRFLVYGITILCGILHAVFNGANYIYLKKSMKG